MAKEELAFCPNCNKPAFRKGKVIVCEFCDATFRFTQEGPRLDQMGPLEARLKTVEEKLGLGKEGKQDTPPAQIEESEDDDL